MGKICGTIYTLTSGSIAFVSGIVTARDPEAGYRRIFVALEIAGQKTAVRELVRAAKRGEPLETSRELYDVAGHHSLRPAKGRVHATVRTLPGGLTHAIVASRLCRYTQSSPIPHDASTSYIIQSASQDSLDPSRLALRIRLQLNLPVLPEAEEEFARTAESMGLVEKLDSAGTICGWAVYTHDPVLWERCLVTATRRAIP